MIHELIHWLAATPASEAIQRTFWLVPVVQTVHLLAIGLVFVSGLFLGLRLLGWAGREQTLAETARRLVPWIWGALAVLLASGSVLIVGEPARTLGNPAFWGKVAAIVLVVALTAALQSRLKRDGTAFTRDGSGAPTAAARWLGAASVLLWLSALTLGRWIAYVLET
jgi:hypothetical protein